MKNKFSLGSGLPLLSKPKRVPLASTVALVASIVLVLGMVGSRMAQQSTQRASSHRLPGAAKHAEERRMSELKQRFEQGVAMLQIRQYEHAVTAFHRVLELNPMLPEAHVNMGFAFYELGDYVGAERFFRGALALNPELPNAQYGLAISQLAQGKLDAAQSAMRKFVESTNDGDPFHVKGFAKLREIDLVLKSKRRPASSAKQEEKSATTFQIPKAP